MSIRRKVSTGIFPVLIKINHTDFVFYNTAQHKLVRYEGATLVGGVVLLLNFGECMVALH